MDTNNSVGKLGWGGEEKMGDMCNIVNNKKIEEFQMVKRIWLWSKTVMKLGIVSGKLITQDKSIEDVPLGSS